jgi:hypothetical protein
MLGRIAIIVALVGCSSHKDPARPAPSDSVPRSALPPEIQPYVPTHGMYLAGGGARSTVFRVIVDTDAKTITSGTAPAGAPLHGKLEDQQTRELTPANQEHLTKLAVDAWSEDGPTSWEKPVEEYEEILVIPDLKDDSAVVFIDEHGPIKRPAAMKLIEAMRAAAALN